MPLIPCLNSFIIRFTVLFSFQIHMKTPFIDLLLLVLLPIQGLGPLARSETVDQVNLSC
jgi:hypothetical protein